MLRRGKTKYTDRHTAMSSSPATETAAVLPEVFSVKLKQLRWTVQAISVEHIWPAKETICEDGPIVVSRLSDGNWFVHNGRHRAIRALLRGEKRIDARLLW